MYEVNCPAGKAECFLQPIEQDTVVNSVECCRQVPQAQSRDLSRVDGGVDVVEHLQKFGLCAVMTTVCRLRSGHGVCGFDVGDHPTVNNLLQNL